MFILPGYNNNKEELQLFKKALITGSFDSIFAIKGDEVIPVENEEEITQISSEWVMLLLKNDVE